MAELYEAKLRELDSEGAINAELSISIEEDSENVMVCISEYDNDAPNGAHLVYSVPEDEVEALVQMLSTAADLIRRKAKK